MPLLQQSYWPVAAIAQQSIPATVTSLFVFPNNIKSLLDKIIRFLSHHSTFKMIADSQTYTLQHPPWCYLGGLFEKVTSELVPLRILFIPPVEVVYKVIHGISIGGYQTLVSDLHFYFLGYSYFKDKNVRSDLPASLVRARSASSFFVPFLVLRSLYIGCRSEQDVILRTYKVLMSASALDKGLSKQKTSLESITKAQKATLGPEFISKMVSWERYIDNLAGKEFNMGTYKTISTPWASSSYLHQMHPCGKHWNSESAPASAASGLQMLLRQ